MKIISESTQELFCYHKTRCTALKEMGEEGRDLFIYLAHNVLEHHSDFLNYTEEPIFVGGLLDGFSAKDQSNMCKALLMALHHQGFCVENIVLEEFLYRLLYADFIFALDTVSQAEDEDRLEFVKPWARLLAIIENKPGLMIPTEEDWDSCFEPALFWDDDFHFFNSLYDSNCLALKAIQTTKKDLEVFENLDVARLIVEPEELWNDYKFDKKDIKEAKLNSLIKKKKLELTENQTAKNNEKGLKYISPSLYQDRDGWFFAVVAKGKSQVKRDLNTRDLKIAQTNLLKYVASLGTKCRAKKEEIPVDSSQPKIKKPKSYEGLVYCIKDQSGRLKIGETSRHIIQRLKALQTSNPDKLEICFTIFVTNRLNAERQIHHELKAFKLTGEWFNCSLNEAFCAFKKIENAEWTQYDTEYKTTVEETNKEVEDWAA